MVVGSGTAAKVGKIIFIDKCGGKTSATNCAKGSIRSFAKHTAASDFFIVKRAPHSAMLTIR